MFISLENDDKNPLGEFGQRATPAAGSRITQIVIKDEDHNGYFERIKDRYVWFPLHDVNFLGRMQVQPMSTDYLYRGRVAWIQSVSYKAIDNSPESMDLDGDGEPPLKTFLLTPYAQALYLDSSYADKGIVTFDHLKGADPEYVSNLEQIILPEVPTDLISLGKYLTTEGRKNIEQSWLDDKDKKVAYETLNLMIKGVNTAIGYCRSLIAESENEILTRRNKGVGKSSLDQNDRYAYVMLQRRIPAEETLENSGDRKTNDLLEKLVAAIAQGKTAEVAPAPAQAAQPSEEVVALRAELDDLKSQLAEALFAFKSVASGKPTLEDITPVAPEVAQNDLKTRLAEAKPKQNPRK